MPMVRNPPTKPTPPPYQYVQFIGPATIYLSDIDAIVTRLAKDASEVIITTGTSVAPSADDLRDATTNELSRLMIQIESPPVDVYLWPKKCQVVTSQDDDFARSVADDAVAMLQQHRRNLFPRFVTQCLISLLTIALVVFMVRTIGTDNLFVSVVAAIFLVGGYGSILVLYNRTLWRSYVVDGRTRIVLRKRQEAHDRRVSLGATVTVGVGSAILGAVVGAVIAAWL